MNLPSWETYCPNTNAINAMAFDLGSVTVYFSYQTPVAFRAPGPSGALHLTVHENIWGVTTGRHLSAIDGGKKEAKSVRVDARDFELMLADELGETA